MKNNRNIILGLGIIISFALLIFSISLYYNYQHDLRQETKLTSESVENMSIEEIKNHFESRKDTQPTFHSFYLLPFIGFIGLLIGTVVYYIMSDKVIHQEQSLKQNSKIIREAVEKNTKREVEEVQTAIANLNKKMEQIMATDFIKDKQQKIEKNKITSTFCAPTGRAAQRIMEAVGCKAKTIHSLIGYKRILHFPMVESKKLRFRIIDSKASPVISNMGVYQIPE